MLGFMLIEILKSHRAHKYLSETSTEQKTSHCPLRTGGAAFPGSFPNLITSPPACPYHHFPGGTPLGEVFIGALFPVAPQFNCSLLPLECRVRGHAGPCEPGQGAQPGE